MSRRMFFPLIAACAILVLLAACGSSASVSGTITYLQEIALPDDAIINMQI